MGGSLQSEPTHVLSIKVLAAKELGKPDYRLGDLTSNLGWADTSSPYVSIATGGSIVLTTAPAKNQAGNPQSTFIYDDTVHTFACHGEDILVLKVHDKRNIQALVRGDPLVGEGSLTIGVGKNVPFGLLEKDI